MSKADVLANYEKRLSCTGALRTQYLKYARAFIDYGNGTLDRDIVTGYIEKLRSAKFSEGTVNFHFRLIRTIFARNHIDWPFNRGEAPPVSKAKLVKPSYSPDLIIKLITSTIKTGTPEEKAFLALSTTYGLRRTEMVHLGVPDVLIKERLLHIATAKHGEERHHLIPEEIVPYLEAWDFSTPLSESYMTSLIYRIEYRAGERHFNRVGWHSIRRALNTALRKRIDEEKTSRFMRWKKSENGSASMSDTYIAGLTVGVGGEITHEASHAAESDGEIFEVHPFIKYWQQEAICQTKPKAETKSKKATPKSSTRVSCAAAKKPSSRKG